MGAGGGGCYFAQLVHSGKPSAKAEGRYLG